MPEAYALTRWEWTDRDFAVMGWHDATIHALAFSADPWELVLDIDYILAWVPPEAGEVHYRFWVAPATLVFEDAADLRISVAPPSELEVLALKRDDLVQPGPAQAGRRPHWRWVVECDEGEITLRASGYRQIFRRPPVFTPRQNLSLEERGGLSFARTPDRVAAV